MSTKPPYLIGITGRSGSGKTSLAHLLSKHLSVKCTHIDMDKVFYKASELNCARMVESELDALNRFTLGLRQLKSWHSVTFPRFDCHTKTYLPRKYNHDYDPSPIIIIEGILALWHSALRDLLDLKIFVDASESVSRARRQNRNANYPGVSEAGRWENVIEPQWRHYLSSTKRHADLIIDGNNINPTSLTLITPKLISDKVIASPSSL